jgi:hypothetical protein
MIVGVEVSLTVEGQSLTVVASIVAACRRLNFLSIVPDKQGAGSFNH